MPQEQKQKILSSDRFLPCVLARLIDSNPQEKKERVAQVFTVEQVRRSVLANLEILLNSRSHIGNNELEDYPDVRTSVLGYGLSDFCGITTNMETVDYLKKELIRQITYFEPRINPDTLEISVIEGQRSNKQEVSLSITGTIVIRPLNEENVFISKLDLDSGKIALLS